MCAERRAARDLEQKKHTQELKAISAKLKAAQKTLGTLYSNEESDKEALENRVKAKERKSALYIRCSCDHVSCARGRVAHSGGRKCGCCNVIALERTWRAMGSAH